MKHLSMLALFLCSSIVVKAQTARAVFFNPNVYRTRIDIPLTRIADSRSRTVFSDKFILKVDRPDKNYSFLDYKIIQELEDGSLIIKVLPNAKVIAPPSPGTTGIIQFTEDTVLKTDTNNAFRYYFQVNKSDIKPLSKTLLSYKVVGIPLIHPVKYRPGKGSEGAKLLGEFTVSYVFGLRLKLCKKRLFRENFITIIPYGFGFGTADYFIENPDKSTTVKEPGIAITYYQGGIMYTAQKINFGIFCGLDAMISKRNDWFYQSQPWLSFGLGYKFKMD